MPFAGIGVVWRLNFWTWRLNYNLMRSRFEFPAFLFDRYVASCFGIFFNAKELKFDWLAGWPDSTIFESFYKCSLIIWPPSRPMWKAPLIKLKLLWLFSDYFWKLFLLQDLVTLAGSMRRWNLLTICLKDKKVSQLSHVNWES